MNIRMKAVTMTALAFAVVIIVFIAIAFKYLAQAREDEMAYRAHELAEMVVAVTEAPLAARDYRRIRELSTRLVSHEDIAYLTIYMGDSVMAYNRNPQEVKQGITVSTDDITVDGVKLGSVSLGYRNHYADSVASPIGRLIIFGTIGLGLLAILIIYFLIYSITKPLRKLHDIAAQGDHSQFDVFYDDEIEQTVAMVNSLKERLDNSYNKLQSSLRDHQMSFHEAQAIEERNQAIYDASLDAIVVADEQDTIIEFSPLAEQLFGWERDEILGKRIAETLIPESMRKSHIAGMQHFLKTGQGPVLNQRIELTAIRRSGREFPVEISISSAKTRTGYIFVSYIRDISKQRQEARDLLTYQQSFQHGYPGIISDAKGHIYSVNQAFTEITGYTKDELLGEKPRTLTDNPDDKRFHKKIWLSVLGNGHWEGVITLKHKEGKRIPAYVKMRATTTDDGTLLNYFAYFAELESNVTSDAVQNSGVNQSPLSSGL